MFLYRFQFRGEIMNFEKTKEYYEQLSSSDLCQCAYCKNYIKEIRKSYPLVAKYLENIGVDIEKPFETMPSKPDEKQNVEYIAVQYLVFGDIGDLKKVIISGVNIDITELHPSTDIKDNHFVIEIFPIILKWVM
ncbi:MAG: hypothetical protein KH116_17690 [Clostridium sp.]|nr:hypothetical protein [Clostridium sp.]